MMTILELTLGGFVLAHVATGFVGLVAFWIPVFARKGGRLHVRAGRVYAYCAYVVTLSAVTVSAGRIVSYQLQGIGLAERPDLYGFAVFLGYLGVVTFATVRQAMRVVATRRTPEKLRTPFHEALGWASIAGSVTVISYALAVWSDLSPILLGLSPIGLFTGPGMLRLMRNPGARHMGWFYSHLGSMLGGGIAFHTAFAVFGAQRFWAYELAGPFAIVPWILPTVIGIPAIIVWTRYYRRKFAPAASAPA
ncbi:MAG: hypothetical protein F4Y45_01985 [Acidobacteria bacterium]|nr:hypothetical protein [Acidobacteriota bacterium]MXZ72237.1 hypothetical protein [Acidobacteriota bacterium]MYD71168.1 hypothetical protein [Acidobacteriota bacterium]MYJ03862.1 hypothetical protein [Acidobacteriota bacterium]